MKHQAPAKVAIALLKNMGDCGFSDSLNYRARAHRTNNEQLAEAISLMLGTLSLHQNDVDVSEIRLRVNSLGKAKSKAQMNWQVDDLLNYLMGLVDKAEEERALPKLRQAVIGGKVVCRGEVVTVIDLDFNNGFAKVMFGTGKVETVMGCQIALMATPFPTCVNPAPKVMYYQQHPEGCIYRITEGKCYVDILLDNGGWREVITTAEQAMARIVLGEYVQCDEEGNPVHHDVLKAEPKVEGWTYFHCLPISGRTGNHRRIDTTKAEGGAQILIDGKWCDSGLTLGEFNSMIERGLAEISGGPKPEPSPVSAPAKPTPKPYTEATDPETGHTYRVDSHGRILVRQAGGHSFYAGNCNVYVVKAVTRLGLLNGPKPEPAAEVGQRMAQSVACELLVKMEAWGFDGSVSIVAKLDDMVATNHLANRLRLSLLEIIGERFNVLDINRHNDIHAIIKAHCAGWISEGHLLKNWKAAHEKLTKIAITGDTDSRVS